MGCLEMRYKLTIEANDIGKNILTEWESGGH